MHMHTHVYAYRYTYIYTYTSIHACTYTDIYTYAQIYIDTYIHIHMYVYACTCTYIHICIYTYIHTHIYTYTHINIYPYPKKPLFEMRALLLTEYLSWIIYCGNITAAPPGLCASTSTSAFLLHQPCSGKWEDHFTHCVQTWLWGVQENTTIHAVLARSALSDLIYSLH